MAHLFKGTAVLKNTLSVKSVLGLSLVMALTACSSDGGRYKREVNGNDSYLNIPASDTLVWPAGVSAPLASNDYLIPAATQGAVGKQIDIRPPVQVMPLLNGARTQLDGDTAVAVLESRVYSAASLWGNLLNTLQREKITIAAQTPADMTLTTDWVSWMQGSDSETVRARYQISVKGEGYNTQLISRLTDLQDSTGQSIAVAADRSRYSAMMLNRIMMSMDEQSRVQEAARVAGQSGGMPVAAGQDNTGLPVYVVRAGYDSVWARLPDALAKIGFSVDERNRPQGQLTLSYKNIGDEGWKALGATDPELSRSAYKLQVGDLGNRTTVALTDADGKPLSDSTFNALLPAMQAAFGNGVNP
ncbi:outer membrane protein assembly factor BamC [Plesiomonas sp.]|uniref:outer membrane protein assembly factor BamC n=1 Tax=Plesiomonas sp. TaxID=2486279 RepID=UPI003F379782